jgi:hypothetical protein
MKRRLQPEFRTVDHKHYRVIRPEDLDDCAPARKAVLTEKGPSLLNPDFNMAAGHLLKVRVFQENVCVAWNVVSASYLQKAHTYADNGNGLRDITPCAQDGGLKYGDENLRPVMMDMGRTFS